MVASESGQRSGGGDHDMRSWEMSAPDPTFETGAGRHDCLSTVGEAHLERAAEPRDVPRAQPAVDDLAAVDRVVGDLRRADAVVADLGLADGVVAQLLGADGVRAEVVRGQRRVGDRARGHAAGGQVARRRRSRPASRSARAAPCAERSLASSERSLICLVVTVPFLMSLPLRSRLRLGGTAERDEQRHGREDEGSGRPPRAGGTERAHERSTLCGPQAANVTA